MNEERQTTVEAGSATARERPSSGYIAPLDGLRAVAIISVLVFHIDPKLLAGGFVGVDLFFVISGFIISRNILAEQAAGTFSLSSFYGRRVARLAPAICITVAATLAVAWVVVGGDRLAEFGRTGFYSIFSVSNFYFWLNSGYFEDSSQTNVFLHTWSLSVEEQFYLIWPFIVLAIAGARRFALPLVMGLLVATSLMSWWISLEAPSAAFFLMPARMFQFLFGAAIAVVHFDKRIYSLLQNQWVAAVGFLVGAGLFGVSLFLADGVAYEFILAAFVPAVGGALMIAGLRARMAEVLMGNRVATAIGRRAYSLYLVHWPVLVLLAFVLGPARTPEFYVMATGLSFLLGEVLYRLVEQPLRQGKKDDTGKRSLKTLGLVGAAIAGVVVSAHAWALNASSNDFADTADTIENASAPDASEAESPYAALGLSNAERLKALQEKSGSVSRYVNSQWAQWSALKDSVGKCQIGGGGDFASLPLQECLPTQGPLPRIAVFGDSLGREAVLALREAGIEENIATVSGAGCLPIYPKNPRYLPKNCRTLNQERFKYLEEQPITLVVLVANWSNSSFSEISETVDYLMQAGKKVVLLGPRPAFSEKVPTLLDSANGEALSMDLSAYQRADYDMMGLEASLRELADSNAGKLFFISEVDAFCPDRCSAFLEDGELIYLDNVHLSPSAARYLGRSLKSQLEGVEGLLSAN